MENDKKYEWEKVTLNVMGEEIEGVRGVSVVVGADPSNNSKIDISVNITKLITDPFRAVDLAGRCAAKDVRRFRKALRRMKLKRIRLPRKEKKQLDKQLRGININPHGLSPFLRMVFRRHVYLRHNFASEVEDVVKRVIVENSKQTETE